MKKSKSLALDFFKKSRAKKKPSLFFPRSRERFPSRHALSAPLSSRLRSSARSWTMLEFSIYHKKQKTASASSKGSDSSSLFDRAICPFDLFDFFFDLSLSISVSSAPSLPPGHPSRRPRPSRSRPSAAVPARCRRSRDYQLGANRKWRRRKGTTSFRV